MKKLNTIVAAVIGVSAHLLTAGANANTIILDGYKGSSEVITCVPSCSAFIGPNPGLIELSGTNGDAYAKAGSSNPTQELALLNELLLQFDPVRAPVEYKDKTNVAQNTWTTDRQYFSIKKSTDFWFFENTSAGTVTLTALGAPWSHTTEYGPAVSEVPLPAAAWLFGSGLLGLIAMKRKRR